MQITAKRIIGEEAVVILSRFLLMNHVLPRLNTTICSLVGMHRLLTAVENGTIGVFVAQDANNAVIGVSWGKMVNSTDWENHFAFARNVDTINGCKAMIEQLKICYGARRIIGNIPECHRSAKLLTRRLGFKDCGLTEYIHETLDGEKYPCRQFILEI